MSDTTPAAPQLGQKCPLGHDYAKRSETGPQGLVDVVFCPACEGLGLLAAGGIKTADISAEGLAVIAETGIRLAPPQAN